MLRSVPEMWPGDLFIRNSESGIIFLLPDLKQFNSEWEIRNRDSKCIEKVREVQRNSAYHNI